MSDFFIVYSGRNSKKVSQIIESLSDELGASRFWYAATRSFNNLPIRETLLSAIQKSCAVLIFESASTYRTVMLHQSGRGKLSQRERILMYEREEALRLKKRVVKIALRSPKAVGLNAKDEDIFNLSMRLNSDSGRANLTELKSFLMEL